MTRYIDADALKAVFEEKSSEAVCGVELCKAIISRIDEAPTIDAVPVIRCKDCKYWQKSSINYNEYVCYWGGYVKQEDDYCSWAERKEE